MKRVVSVAAVVVSMLVVTTMAASGDGNPHSKREYEVTITNVTKGETFTPLLVVSHRGPVQIFELGVEASEELEDVAETGNTDPLKDLLLPGGLFHALGVTRGPVRRGARGLGPPRGARDLDGLPALV